MAVNVGRTGIWCGSRIWPEDSGASAEAAAELEELGYQALWLGMSAPSLELPQDLLAATSTLTVVTGIVSVWDAPPDAVAAAYHRVAGAYPGRFLLGLGASHPPVVERSGQRYHRPYSKVAGFLDQLDAATPPVPRDGRALAALGPRMLALAARRTAGATHTSSRPSTPAVPGRRSATGRCWRPSRWWCWKPTPAGPGRSRGARFVRYWQH